MNTPTNLQTGNKYKGSILLLTLFPIFLGLCIYLLFRGSSPIFFSWLSLHESFSWLQKLQTKGLQLSQHLPAWFIYSLPNGLWAFAYTLIIAGIWWKAETKWRYLWLANVPLLVLGFELLQLNKIIPGVFCFVDLTFSIVGILAGNLLGNYLTQTYRHEEKLHEKSLMA